MRGRAPRAIWSQRAGTGSRDRALAGNLESLEAGLAMARVSDLLLGGLLAYGLVRAGRWLDRQRREERESESLDERLDDALDESFPASDPPAVHRVDTA